MKHFRLVALLLIATSAATVLTGCTATVSLEAAPDANNPKCAEVIVRLPDDIEGQLRRTTNAQSTSAWGEPASIILRCGLPPVEASTLKCITVSSVDWLVDDTNAPSYRFISFGRNPATEVIVDSQNASGATALDALSPLVQLIEATRSCQLPD